MGESGITGLSLETLLNGTVIPVDKPRQWTSFQAVNKIKAAIRNRYGIKKFKIGHAGTLDPLATGLLLVCVGKATKSIPQLQDGEKVYSGTMVLGATTPCFDLERPIDARYPYSHITPELLEEARRQFLGDIQQVPPIFSAVKIGGQRAYKIAREAISGDNAPTPKTVHIAEFDITGFRRAPAHSFPTAPANSQLSIPNSQFSILNSHLYKSPLGTVPPELPQIDFRIHCGNGTYIRSLARDFGLALDSGAFLSALRREQVGDYTLDDAIPLDAIETLFAQ